MWLFFNSLSCDQDKFIGAVKIKKKDLVLSNVLIR